MILSAVSKRKNQTLAIMGTAYCTVLFVSVAVTTDKTFIQHNHSPSRNELTEVESRTRGSRPRTQKKSEAKDSLSEDRHSRGQGQECSRPRTKDTSASALQKKKKVFTKIFQAISTKKRFPNNFSGAPQNFNNSKNSAVLEPRTGQFSRT